MPTDDADPLLEEMRESVRSGGAKRSRLSVWMAGHAAEIAAMIAAYGADWDRWGALFVRRGLLAAPEGWGEDGPEGAAARRRAAMAARQTWLRVRKRGGGGKAGAKPTQRRAAGDREPPVPAADADAGRRRMQNFERELRERSK